MRLFTAVFLCLTVVTPALADDSPPPYGAEDLAIESDALPEGWSMLDDDAAYTAMEALEADVMRVVTGAGIDEADVLVAVRMLAHEDGTRGALVLVEMDGDAGALTTALRARSEWGVRTMGHPTRLLLVVAPETIRPRLVALETAYAVETLTMLAFERIEAGSRVGALAHAAGARAIDEAAGMPHAVDGLAAVGEGELEAAIAAFRRAFAPQAALHPEGRLALQAYAQWGLALLLQKNPSLDREAVDVLQKAVGLESEAEPRDQPAINRYNLACALSRVGQVDGALTQLERCFAMARTAMERAAFQNFVKHAMEDEDLTRVREDERWAPLLQRVVHGGGERSPLDGM